LYVRDALLAFKKQCQSNAKSQTFTFEVGSKMIRYGQLHGLLIEYITALRCLDAAAGTALFDSICIDCYAID
jgi:hypothetical protein